MLNQAVHLPLSPRILPDTAATSDESMGLDTEFRRYFLQRMLPFTRVGLGIWIVLALTACVFDGLIAPEAFAERAIPLRVFTMLVPLSAALVATFVIRHRIWLPYLVASAAGIAGFSAVAVGAVAARTGAIDVYGSAIFSTLCIYLVLGLTLRQSIAVAWPVFFAYLGVSSVLSFPFQAAAYGVLFLGLTNIIGSVSSFLIERSGRESFDNKQELRRLERTDGLTGLFSRRAFDQHLRQIWKQAEREDSRVAVVVADIDHFKLYNDCYGHRMGDGCIRAVADVVATSVNRPLDMVARYGGEEFVIVLYDPTPGFLESFSRGLCHKIIDLSIEHKASETKPVVSLSIGAAITEASGPVKADQLIRQADDALYEAKNQGRSQAIVYRSEWGQQTTANLASVLV